MACRCPRTRELVSRRPERQDRRGWPGFGRVHSCLSVDVDVVLPEVSPAVFARAAAVPVSSPAMIEVVSSAVFARGHC